MQISVLETTCYTAASQNFLAYVNKLPLSMMQNLPYATLIQALDSAPPDQPFVTMWENEDDVQTVTFGEFKRRAEAQAVEFRKHGVQPGDKVVLIMPQGIPLMTAFAGAMLAGAIPAILAYPSFKVEPSKYRFGLSGVTKNLNASLVVIDEAFPSDLMSCLNGFGSTTVVRMSSAPSIDRNGDEVCPSAIDRNQLAFIQHSAGTTGLQKGVALSHAAVLRQLNHLVPALQISSRDRIYSWLPLYHDMGLIACFMLPMVCHLHVVMQSPTGWVMQPETMLRLISDYRCTLAWLPNFAFQFLARRVPQELRKSFDLSSVRMFINCSEPVRARSMDEFYAAFEICGLRLESLQASYAMAENVFAVTQSGRTDGSGPVRILVDGQRFRDEHRAVAVNEAAPGALLFVSSGHCLPDNQVRIVSGNGIDLKEGNVGEILIRSDSLFDGYYNRPDLTAKAIKKGWYSSGDLGFVMGEELFVVGRKKDLIIVAGKNIYPQDVEEITCSHTAIHDGRAVAMGFYNAELGTEDIVVVAELEDERNLTNAVTIEREIRSSISAELEISVRWVYLKPPKWIVKSTAGKPARSTTREKLLREHPELNASAPSDDLRYAIETDDQKTQAAQAESDTLGRPTK